MTELSGDVKTMLHKDIDESNIRGIHDTLDIILGKSDNPNIIQVEFTLSQIEYLDKWSRRLNGATPDSLIRMMVDTMMRQNPH